MVETQLPNGVIENRFYDKLNRLIELENKLGNQVISGYEYTLDKVGNRLAVGENDGRIVEYEYDDLYRLIEERIVDGNDVVNDGRIISYVYDNVGNRLTKADSVEGVTSYVYNGNDWLLSEGLVKDGVTVSNSVYSYDDNGNTISVVVNGSEETVYKWNQENRLEKVILSDGKEVNYQYDVERIRVASSVDGVTTNYLVDTNLPYAQVLEEYVDGELSVSYVYGLDLISQNQGITPTFYLVDGLGSTRILTDSNGDVVNRYDYEAFGELIGSSGTTENNYLFAGEQFDENLGDYYLRQRYYDTDTGRFTRRDSYEGNLNDPVTLHKYLYGNGNPVNGIDPSGLFTIQEAILGTAMLGILVAIPSSTPKGAIQFTLLDPKVAQVRGYFDRAAGHLTLYDLSNNTPNPVVITGIFSGNGSYRNKPQFESVKNNGPIPSGTYEIFNDALHPTWYRLDRFDSNPRNDKDDDLYGRDGFRLHPGNLSLGCITVPKTAPKEWKQIDDLLQKTNKEENVRDRKGYLWWTKNVTLTKYGTIYVY